MSELERLREYIAEDWVFRRHDRKWECPHGMVVKAGSVADAEDWWLELLAGSHAGYCQAGTVGIKVEQP